MNRTDRLYALVEELRASAPLALSARRLAGRFEVGVRTIQRDILTLQEAACPSGRPLDPAAGCTTDSGHTLPPLNFTPSEAAAIALAMARSGPMPFDGAARTALHKVVAAMSASGRTGAADLLARIHLLHARSEPLADPVRQVVEQALVEQRVLCLDYRDKHGQPTSREGRRSVTSGAAQLPPRAAPDT